MHISWFFKCITIQSLLKSNKTIELDFKVDEDGGGGVGGGGEEVEEERIIGDLNTHISFTIETKDKSNFDSFEKSYKQ
jgi:hypothetical protein